MNTQIGQNPAASSTWKMPSTRIDGERKIIPAVRGAIATIIEIAVFIKTDDYDKTAAPKYVPSFLPVYAFVDPETGETHTIVHQGYGMSLQFYKDNNATVSFISDISGCPKTQIGVRTWMNQAVNGDYLELVGLKVLLTTTIEASKVTGRPYTVVSKVAEVPPQMLQAEIASKAPQPVIPGTYKPLIQSMIERGDIIIMDDGSPRRLTSTEAQAVRAEREAIRKQEDEGRAYAQRAGIATQVPTYMPQTQAPVLTAPAPIAPQVAIQAAVAANAMAKPAAAPLKTTPSIENGLILAPDGNTYPLNADGTFVIVEGPNAGTWYTNAQGELEKLADVPF